MGAYLPDPTSGLVESSSAQTHNDTASAACGLVARIAVMLVKKVAALQPASQACCLL